MENQRTLPIIPLPSRGKILLAVTPSTGLQAVTVLLAHLALRGPLLVIDAGNVFPGYQLVRELRSRIPGGQELLRQVMLSRVFTTYQLQAILDKTPADPHPLVVLDLLSTFYDQNAKTWERERILRTCLARLKALGQSRPLVIWARQRSLIPADALPFLELLRAAASEVWSPALPQTLSFQQAPLLHLPAAAPPIHKKPNRRN